MVGLLGTAHTEGLDLVEDSTYMQRLQDNDGDGASDIGMRCVEHLRLYQDIASTDADSLDTHMRHLPNRRA